MEFHDAEKASSYVSPSTAVDDGQAVAGQDPSARHNVSRPSFTDLSTTDEVPIDNDREHVSPDVPVTEPNPEALVRQPSGPIYSVFSPGTKKWIIAVVTLTSFISPMTAVSMTLIKRLPVVRHEA